MPCSAPSRLTRLSFWANRLLGSTLYYARRYDESLVALKRASEIAPDQFELVEGWYSGVFEMQGRYSDAFAGRYERHRVGGLSSEHPVVSHRLRDRGMERLPAGTGEVLAPSIHGSCHMNPVAMSYVRLGDLQEALRWFSRDLR